VKKKELKNQNIGIGCFSGIKENPKVLYFMVYFLLKNLMKEDEMKVFMGIYPPQNSSDTIEFKNICFQ
jgi:hypothetical protein